MKNLKFDCKIVEKGENERGKFVVLKGNRFYPDGKGGQIGDRGKIGESIVLFSEERGYKVLLYVDRVPRENATISCEIDISRRHTISALHTAQHILSAILEDKFNVETVAFHMSEDTCTIDVSPYTVSFSMLQRVEEAVNKVVFQNLPVKKYFATEEEINQMKLRSKHEVHGKIRIVEIPGIDISMCGGTHVDYTGEIGIVKILGTEKIKKQLLRIYFTAEKRALGEFQEKVILLRQLTEMLTCGERELHQKMEKMLAEIKVLKKENKNLKISIIKNLVSGLVFKKGNFVQKKVDFEKAGFMNLLLFLSRERTGKIFLIYSERGLILGVARGTQADSDTNFREVFQSFFARFNAKGISKSNFLFAEFSNKANFERALQFVKEELS